MKTLVHFVQGAALVGLLFVSGCQKEIPTPYCKKPAPPSAQPKACDPWRSVIGYTALFSELNAFAVCDVVGCSGNSVTTTLVNGDLDDPSTGYAYTVSSNQTVTASEQTAIMNAAQAWAVANKPTGYFVSQIVFSEAIIPDDNYPILTSTIKITVTYRKCTGGGGGEG
jgi:hypothetical protein